MQVRRGREVSNVDLRNDGREKIDEDDETHRELIWGKEEKRECQMRNG